MIKHTLYEYVIIFIKKAEQTYAEKYKFAVKRRNGQNI